MSVAVVHTGSLGETARLSAAGRVVGWVVAGAVSFHLAQAAGGTAVVLVGLLLVAWRQMKWETGCKHQGRRRSSAGAKPTG